MEEPGQEMGHSVLVTETAEHLPSPEARTLDGLGRCGQEAECEELTPLTCL